MVLRTAASPSNMGAPPRPTLRAASAGRLRSGSDAVASSLRTDFGRHFKEEEFEVQRILGSGSFGEVLLVRHPLTRRQLAMKCIDGLTGLGQRERQALELEVHVLKKVNHPCAVACEDTIHSSPDRLCIIMEYCTHGDVDTYLRERSRRGDEALEEGIALKWVAQVCLGLHALHARRILHRDLKTHNLLLTGSMQSESIEGLAVKLGDFGISRSLSMTTEFATTLIGTPMYMAPEVFDNQPYSFESDLWGLGCILFELTNGHKAFEACGVNALVIKVISGSFAPFSESCTPRVRDLVRSLLSTTPGGRPSVQDVLHATPVRRCLRSAVESAVASAGAPEEMLQRRWMLAGQLASLGFEGLLSAELRPPASDGATSATGHRSSRCSSAACRPARVAAAGRGDRGGDRGAAEVARRGSEASGAAAAPQELGAGERQNRDLAARCRSPVVVGIQGRAPATRCRSPLDVGIQRPPLSLPPMGAVASSRPPSAVSASSAVRCRSVTFLERPRELPKLLPPLVESQLAELRKAPAPPLLGLSRRSAVALDLKDVGDDVEECASEGASTSCDDDSFELLASRSRSRASSGVEAHEVDDDSAEPTLLEALALVEAPLWERRLPLPLDDMVAARNGANLYDAALLCEASASEMPIIDEDQTLRASDLILLAKQRAAVQLPPLEVAVAVVSRQSTTNVDSSRRVSPTSGAPARHLRARSRVRQPWQ